jgi:hypothetical protein
MKLPTTFCAVVLGLVGAIAVPVASAGAGGYDVHPGQSIQAAINATPAGGHISIAPGTYHENLDIAKAITLDGHDTVITPGGTVNESPCTQPAESVTPSSTVSATSDIVTGICIHGTVDQNFNPTSYVADVTIEDITSTGWSGDGAFAVASDHLDVHDSEFSHNGGYGIFALHSKRVHYHDSSAHDNSEAGFYVGESPEANVRIRDNVSYRNLGEGVLFRDSQGGKISDNKLFENCAGLFLLDTGAPGVGGHVRAYDNRVKANNKACPGSGDAPPFSGIGIAILGDTGTRVEDNKISDHTPGGPSALPTGGLIVLDTTGFGGTVPTNNRVEDNRLKHNSPVDIFSDGSGSGNTFEHNRCNASVPGGLCS